MKFVSVHKTEIEPRRIEVVDALRGIAALSVCWYHFTQSPDGFLPSGLVKSSGSYGYLGVSIFFVISGFIIPYSLRRGGYRICDYCRFLAKRLVRVDPPYLVSVALILLVGFVLMHTTHSRRGVLPFSSWRQVAFHLGYFNELLGYEWLSPIYWTLAIEFQFYLLFGLIYPLLSRRHALSGLVVVGCVLGSLCHSHGLVLTYLPWFCFGTVADAFVTRQIGLRWYLALTAVLLAHGWYFYGPYCDLVLVSTSALISLVRFPTGGLLSFLGTISYSIYLMHVPVGRTIIDLSSHFQPGYSAKLGVLALAVGATVLGSYLLYQMVERPAMRWSGKIRYRGSKTSRPGKTCPERRAAHAP